jgi:hypothetical protein
MFSLNFLNYIWIYIYIYIYIYKIKACPCYKYYLKIFFIFKNKFYLYETLRKNTDESKQ